MTSALYYPGTLVPLTRGYGLRTASTQAGAMDRNLMFYYEHLGLYDPNQVSRSSTSEQRAPRTRPQLEEAHWQMIERNAHSQAQMSQSSEPEMDVNESQSEVIPSEPITPVATPPPSRDCIATPPPAESTTESTGPEVEMNHVPLEEPASPPSESPITPLATPPPARDYMVAPPPAQNYAPGRSSTEDPPPSYHPPSYANMDDSPLPHLTHCHPELAENLRRFLLFCLAIDYDLVNECPEKLRQADWLPFLRLARHWNWRDSRRRYQQGFDPVRPAFLGNPSTVDSAEDDERARKIEQCIFACVVRPAQALQIPPDIAITLLRQFPSSITSLGDYIPYWHRYRCPNTKSLATKLLLDREILFDTITKRDHQPFRSALHEANERVANKNFVLLRSPDDYELTQFGIMREKLEGNKTDVSDMVSGLEADLETGREGKSKKRFSRWVRKLSSA